MDQCLVKVIAAQMSVARCTDNLKHLVTVRVIYFQHRHIKGTAAQIEHHDLLVFCSFQAVGHRRRGRFIDDTSHFKTGNLTGVLGGLALGVVEVGGNSDHRLIHLVAQVRLGRLLELTERFCRNLGGRKLLIGRFNSHEIASIPDNFVGDHLLFIRHLFVTSPHKSLHRVNGIAGVRHRLTAGRFANQCLAVLCEGDHTRCQPSTLGIGDDFRFRTFHHRHHRIGCAEVNSDDFFTLCHGFLLLEI